jgi:hypothetical protein
MTVSPSRSLQPTSDQDTSTTVRSSLEVSHRNLLPFGLFTNTLRFRRSSYKRRPSVHSLSPSSSPLKQSEMFNSRKYTPLPTNSYGQRKRAGGGMTAWKRWLLVGGAVSVLLVVGYSYSGPRNSAVAWDSESECFVASP